MSSSYTAAAYLSSIGFGQSLQPGKHVLLLGSQGTADELAAAGLQVLDAKQLQLPVLDSVDAMLQMQVSMPGTLPAEEHVGLGAAAAAVLLVQRRASSTVCR